LEYSNLFLLIWLGAFAPSREIFSLIRRRGRRARDKRKNFLAKSAKDAKDAKDAKEEKTVGRKRSLNLAGAERSLPWRSWRSWRELFFFPLRARNRGSWLGD